MARPLNVRNLLAEYFPTYAYRVRTLIDPYPWAIDEGFDIYRTLTETKGGIIGMNGQKLDIIMCGDSAWVFFSTVLTHDTMADCIVIFQRR